MAKWPLWKSNLRLERSVYKEVSWCFIKNMNVTYIKNVPQSSYIISYLYQILYRSQVSTVTRNVMKGHDKI